MSVRCRLAHIYENTYINEREGTNQQATTYYTKEQEHHRNGDGERALAQHRSDKAHTIIDPKTELANNLCT